MSEVVIPTTTNLGLKKPTYDNFADIKDAVDDNMDILDQAYGNIAKTIYPVGAIYMSIVNTDPGTLFPGTTWSQLTNRFLIGAGGSYAVNTTGGAASQSYTPAGSVGGTTLTINQIPSHDHSFSGSAVTSGINSVGHSHGMGNHTHSLSSHIHSLSDHTHTMSSHTHGLSNHTHSLSSHTHSGPNHSHTIYVKKFSVTPGSGYDIYGVGSSDWYDQTASTGSAGNGNTGGPSTSNTGTPSNNTSGGPSSNSTGGPSTNVTGTPSNNTSGVPSNNNTGTQSANHTHSVTAAGTVGAKGGGQSHNHGFTGTAATISTMPPYLAVYMWKRTA